MTRTPLRLSINPGTKETLFDLLCIGLVYSFMFWTLLNSICCILLFAAWLFFGKPSFDLSTTRTRLMLLFTTPYLIALLGMLYTQNTAEGLSRLQEKLPILLFPIIFGTSTFLTQTLFQKITTHFIIATAISAIVGIGFTLPAYIHTGLAESMTGKHLLVFPDMYPYLLGLCALMSILLLFFGPAGPLQKSKSLQLAILILLSLNIILLGTRVIIACWLVILLCYIFTKIPGLSYRILTTTLLLLFTILAVITIPPLHRQWNELVDFSGENAVQLDKDASLGRTWGGKSIRQAIWKCGSDIAQRHWLTGVGTGDVQDSLQQAYEDRRFYFASRYNRYNAHNQYLQSFLGQGIAGLCTLILCILVPVFTWQQRLDRVRRICYLTFIAMFAIICFTEVILDINKGVIWYSFFNSIFAFMAYVNKPLNTKNQ